MQERAKREGAILNGQMAVSMSNNAEYIKNIAREALEPPPPASKPAGAHVPMAWKNGRREPCTNAEFTHQIRHYAELADEKFGFLSSGHAHVGERIRAAADLIDWLTAENERLSVVRPEVIKAESARTEPAGAPSEEDVIRAWWGDLELHANAVESWRSNAGRVTALLRRERK